MNDEVDAATTQILNGPPGSEIGTGGFSDPDRGDRMWNLAPLIPPEQRFSRIYRGRKELIDHIFVSNFVVINNRRPPAPPPQPSQRCPQSRTTQPRAKANRLRPRRSCGSRSFATPASP
jgi:hypothetical protein